MMSDAMPADAPPVEDHAVEKIHRDAPCFACGYNLRGMFYDRSCPECGKRIADWVREDRLDGLEARTAARWRRGALLLQTGVVLAMPLIYPGLIVAAVGLWWLTARPGGVAERISDRATRMAARWFLGIGLVLATAVVVAAVWRAGLRPRELFGEWLATDIGIIAAGACCVFGLAGAWLHISEIARRIPDGVLAARCVRLRRQWFAGLGVFVAVALAANAVRWTGLERHLYELTEGLPALLAGLPLAATLLWLWWHTLWMTVDLRAAMSRL